jgi:phosphoribosylformylglycinamidine synthase
VLGAGGGWASSILLHAGAREAFERFFRRGDAFTLGVCNGCQMLSQLRELIPGAENWPRFIRNRSEQFEARLVTVEVLASPSILFEGMHGSRIPVASAHGEGQVNFDALPEKRGAEALGSQVALRFVDNHGLATEHYPLNPNGSWGGITGITNADGRVTALMPHPERVFRTVQMSWAPKAWPDASPWARVFENARRFVG